MDWDENGGAFRNEGQTYGTRPSPGLQKRRLRVTPRIFFAIPCGGFYEEQRKVIEAVCDYAGIDRKHRIIIEQDDLTAELWGKITNEIERSDFFMADISSGRANIVLELGYALKSKHLSHIAIFVSNHAPILEILSDLAGETRFPYSSMANFRVRLKEWLEEAVFSEHERLKDLSTDSIKTEEHFKDFDNFLKLWSIPPGCQFSLTSDGLRFGNAYYPILSTTLGLLRDYAFTFRARIEREAIGWLVKGTVDYKINSPIFGVMFNITQRGTFRPHILCPWTKDEKLDYYPRDAKEIQAVEMNTGLSFEKPDQFEVTTDCSGDMVSVQVRQTSGKTWDWSSNLAEHPILGKYYNSVKIKQGQVGFRCAGWRETGVWGEVATVNWVKVEETERTNFV